MLNLTRGQVLKGISFVDDCTVIGVIEGLTCVADKKYGKFWYTDAEIEKYFELPKEKWVPKVGEGYWYLSSILIAENTKYHAEDCVDKERLETGNCFPTQEAAEAAAEKIKALLKSL